MAADPATPFGRNLLRNPGAEMTSETSNIPGWQDIEGLNEQPYGGTPSEWKAGTRGCPRCGRFYMRITLGPNTKGLAANQVVKVEDAAKDIDSGRVTANISGYIGALRTTAVTTQMVASFQDGTGKNLGQLTTSEVSATDLPASNSGGSIVFREQSGPVPSGTRQILFQWQAKPAAARQDASGNGSQTPPAPVAFGDNFSLIIRR
jgi:uncharacterized protein YdbL (DUF1318 family)